ncbi:MAG: CinA family protein [Mariprofundaceae bacterium]|nr:CinA family protein [Mariprofundaceae bacterium]
MSYCHAVDAQTKMTSIHIIASNSALTELGQAGVTPGWLTAWLLSTGKKRVLYHHLQDESWQSLTGAQLFIADRADLMPVAMAHGRRLGANRQGQLQVIGAEPETLQNPERIFWHYQHQGETIVLMPIGDIAEQREKWLSKFSAGNNFLPIHITTSPNTRTNPRFVMLEPSLYAHIDDAHGHHPPLDDCICYINHSGMMPELQLQQLLRCRGWRLNTAESCTAGAFAARFSRMAGASMVLDRTWVTYSNHAKLECLGIAEDLIQKHGAVSEAVVLAMADAAASDCKTMAVAISGIAGPSGGSPEKPVGTVWAAIAIPNMATRAFKLLLTSSRTSIQAQAVAQVMAEACVRLTV